MASKQIFNPKISIFLFVCFFFFNKSQLEIQVCSETADNTPEFPQDSRGVFSVSICVGVLLPLEPAGGSASIVGSRS